MARHKESKWKEQNIASHEYEDLLSSFKVQSHPDHIAVDGVCPICLGGISTVSPKRFQAPNSTEDVIGQASSGPVYWEVIVECNCGQRHAGQPRASEGCGMALKIGVNDG